MLREAYNCKIRIEIKITQMMRNFILIVLVCTLSKISSAQTVLNNDSARILIINSFDATYAKVRKNKRELLVELTDSLKNYLAKEIRFQVHNKTTIVPGIIIETGNSDSLINSLLEQNNATKAILIRETDVYFNSGNSRTEQEYGEKAKTINPYDLCSKIKYVLYQKNKNPVGREMEDCKFFTERSTQGRFSISFGPDIVGKKKHTFGAVAANAARYVSFISTELKSQ